MDIPSIATQAISMILPFIAKGGEEIAKSMGKDLWEVIKKPFTTEKDKTLIETLEKNPDDIKAQAIVEYKLGEFLKENPVLASELEELCKRVPASFLQNSNNQVVSGTDNIGVQNVSNSTIKIKK